MVRNVKQIGGGDTAQVVEEYVLDTGLLREVREIEKQAAIECGDCFEHEKAPDGSRPERAGAGAPGSSQVGPGTAESLGGDYSGGRSPFRR